MKANDGKIAVTAYDAKTLEGYQIKGTTEYITEGAIVDTFKKQERTVIHFAFALYSSSFSTMTDKPLAIALRSCLGARIASSSGISEAK